MAGLPCAAARGHLRCPGGGGRRAGGRRLRRGGADRRGDQAARVAFGTTGINTAFGTPANPAASGRCPGGPRRDRARGGCGRSGPGPGHGHGWLGAHPRRAVRGGRSQALARRVPTTAWSPCRRRSTTSASWCRDVERLWPPRRRWAWSARMVRLRRLVGAGRGATGSSGSVWPGGRRGCATGRSPTAWLGAAERLGRASGAAGPLRAGRGRLARRGDAVVRRDHGDHVRRGGPRPRRPGSPPRPALRCRRPQPIAAGRRARRRHLPGGPRPAPGPPWPLPRPPGRRRRRADAHRPRRGPPSWQMRSTPPSAAASSPSPASPT